MMTDEELIGYLRAHASKLEKDGWEIAPTMIRETADRLKQLTGVKKPTERSVHAQEFSNLFNRLRRVKDHLCDAHMYDDAADVRAMYDLLRQIGKQTFMPDEVAP
jgi:hypothetical protein